ncbi:MAG: (2Fe-2S)-binding protein [Verrucomicrobia bacterium]|nr:(2Fe-2S)-binding protein [Leptolyngbya sp. ES-bin-22]
MSVRIHFLPDDVTIDAQPGESLLRVADRAGVSIPTGCLMGSCHACEVELDGEESVCSCISAVPDGRSRLTVNLYADSTW